MYPWPELIVSNLVCMGAVSLVTAWRDMWESGVSLGIAVAGTLYRAHGSRAALGVDYYLTAVLVLAGLMRIRRGEARRPWCGYAAVGAEVLSHVAWPRVHVLVHLFALAFWWGTHPVADSAIPADTKPTPSAPLADSGSPTTHAMTASATTSAAIRPRA